MILLEGSTKTPQQASLTTAVLHWPQFGHVSIYSSVVCLRLSVSLRLSASSHSQTCYLLPRTVRIVHRSTATRISSVHLSPRKHFQQNCPGLGSVATVPFICTCANRPRRWRRQCYCFADTFSLLGNELLCSVQIYRKEKKEGERSREGQTLREREGQIGRKRSDVWLGLFAM